MSMVTQKKKKKKRKKNKNNSYKVTNCMIFDTASPDVRRRCFIYAHPYELRLSQEKKLAIWRAREGEDTEKWDWKLSN